MKSDRKNGQGTSRLVGISKNERGTTAKDCCTSRIARRIPSHTMLGSRPLTNPSTHPCFGRLKSFSLIFGIAGSAVDRSSDCTRAGGGGVEAGVAVVERLPFDLPNLIFMGTFWLGVSRLAAAICPEACHFGGSGFVLTFSVRRKRR
jgi:hypothetical protein